MREGESEFSQREVDTTLALLIDTRAWMLRRTDRIELRDTYTIRRTIQFEIELPEWTLEAFDNNDCRLILPIGVFGGGQALRNLEVTFGQEPAGTLTRHAGDRLTALLRERLKKNGDLGIPSITRKFLDQLLEIEVEGEGEAGQMGRGALDNGNYFLFLTSDKSVERQGTGGSRFVVTVSTDQTLVRRLDADKQPDSIRRALRAIGLGRVTRRPTEVASEQGLIARTYVRIRNRLADLAETIMPQKTDFVVAQTISGFGDARSWQLEVYAPSELRISDGALIWWPDDEDPATNPPQPTSTSSGSNPPRASNSMPPAVGKGTALPTRRGSSAVALTRFRVQADSIRHIGMLVTLATLALLAVAIGIALNAESTPIVDAVVAILVIAPSLGASIVTNPENHEMAGDYLRPLRQRIYMVGFLAALAAAFFIIFGLSGASTEYKEQTCEKVVPTLTGVGLERCENQVQRAQIWEDLWPIDGFDPGKAADEAFNTWSTNSLLSFAVLILIFLLLLRVAWQFHTLDRQIRKRSQLGAEILSRKGKEKELDLKVFEETTLDERIPRGLFGRLRSILNSRRYEKYPRKLVPLETLSVDPIDLGPRAIFRIPPKRDDYTPEPRVETGVLESRLWMFSRDKTKARRDAKNRLPGLFDRFFFDTWFGSIPPSWFFWSSDIEADYISYEPVERPQAKDPA